MIHIIGCSRNPSRKDIAVDPYARVSYFLTKYLGTRYSVTYYGHSLSDVPNAQEHVHIVDEEYHKKYNVLEYQNNHWAHNSEAEGIYVTNAAKELDKRVLPNDIVLITWSSMYKPLQFLEERGAKLVNAHIGHLSPSYANYSVYTSNALRHHTYGIMNSDKSKWHDAVIPPMAFESSEFEFSWKKGDYILFMSRLNEDKGLGIFLQLAEHFPERKFKLAGQGTLSQELPPNVEFLGYLGLEERKEYLKNAACVVTPTHYIEPFGLTAVEAAISGTPIITTNWGGYTDNVIHGVTGFRCSYFEDFVQAIKNIDKLDRNDCRGFGELFAAESLLGRWEEYLHNVQKDSWYEIS